jgi:hypothetical protein
METRCGCPTYIVVKLGNEKKYQITLMIEEHNLGFVSPDKRNLLRSNRKVSERAKLFKIVIRLALTSHRHINFSMSVRVGLRMLGAQEGFAKLLPCPQNQNQGCRCTNVCDNLSERRK